MTNLPLTPLLIKDRADSSIISTIDNATATFSCTTAQGARFPASNFIVYIESEKMLVANRTDDTFSGVTRGYDSTTAVAHSGGVRVIHPFESIAYTTLNDNLSGHTHDQIDVSGLPTALSLKQDLGAKSVASGYASLNLSGRVPSSELGAGTATSTTFLNGAGNWATPAGGAGESNSGINIGASGIGIFVDKSGVDLRFARLNPSTNQIGITLSGTQIDFDVVENNISLQNLTGKATGTQLGLEYTSVNLGTLVNLTANTYATGPSINISTGIWMIWGRVTVRGNTATAHQITAKMWNGSANPVATPIIFCSATPTLKKRPGCF